MGFENLQNDDNRSSEDHEKMSGEKTESALHEKFGKAIQCAKRWSKVGALVGSLFVVGELKMKEYEEDLDWQESVTSTLSGEDIKKREAHNTALRSLFGDEVIIKIEQGDKEAFKRRYEERKEPKSHGLPGKEWDGISKYMLTEQYSLYPRGWINGEIDNIYYIDSVKEKRNNLLTGGTFNDETSSPAIFLYRLNKEKGGKIGGYVSPEEVVDHELGHANDWEHDMDLNIVERQELLLKVVERLRNANAFQREGEFHYHESFLDGTKEGLYRAAKEYWADICSQYFGRPEQFLKQHPDDFSLVDSYAKKNDNEFNIFNKNRGAVDPHTGAIRDVWKE